MAGELVKKLAAVMDAVERVPKRGRNSFHNYDYATEADIVATVRKELASRHVMLIPAIVGESRTAVGEKGSVLTVLEMEMEFLDGDSGDSIKKTWRGYGTDKEDKGGYKAMTGGEKYFLLKTFLMPTGDDPEADEKPSAVKAASVTGAAHSAPPASAHSGGAVQSDAQQRGAASGPPPLNGSNYATRQNTQAVPEVPDGAVLIKKVESSPTKNKNVTKFFITLSTGEQVTTIKQQLASLCEQLCQDNVPVNVETTKTKWGTDLVSVQRVAFKAEPFDDDFPPPIDTDDPLPF